jgi:hypothetical protein
MSGPIVRKYGFPNYDKIFGKQPLQHGADEQEEPEPEHEEPKSSKPKGKSSTKTRGSRAKKSE